MEKNVEDNNSNKARHLSLSSKGEKGDDNDDDDDGDD